MDTALSASHGQTKLLYDPAPSRLPDARTPDGESVSIIMRTKDRVLMLPRSFGSILSQTLQDWHLYLINDGGSPAPVDLAVEEFAPAFEGRITVVHNPKSLGMEAASNVGLLAAKGTFFAVHDDDDTWHPEFLARTVAYLTDPQNAAKVGVATAVYAVEERITGDTIVELSCSPWGYFRKSVTFPELLYTNSMPPICLLLRRALTQSIGTYNPHLPVLGDWEYAIRALMAGEIGVIDERLAYYHVRHGPADSYSNTVTAGVERHRRYNHLLRDDVIRQSLRAHPELLGVLQPIFLGLRELHESINAVQRELHESINAVQRELHERIETLQADSRADSNKDQEEARQRLDRIVESLELINRRLDRVEMVASWQQKMLRPARWLWLRLLPLRRTLARVRGRV